MRTTRLLGLALPCLLVLSTSAAATGDPESVPQEKDHATATAAAKPPPRCLEPIKPGRCRGYIPRYAYDQEEQCCVKFGWGGCRPNGNNFKSKAACKKACRPPSPPLSRCDKPKAVGPCEGYFPRWFHDSATSKCKRFGWGGCGGNDNRFKHKASCIAACKTQQQPGIDPPGPSICELPQEPGLCLAYMPSWYYDAEAMACKRFIYGGCGGNRNRFVSKEECEKACP